MSRAEIVERRALAERLMPILTDPTLDPSAGLGVTRRLFHGVYAMSPWRPVREWNGDLFYRLSGALLEQRDMNAGALHFLSGRLLEVLYGSHIAEWPGSHYQTLLRHPNTPPAVIENFTRLVCGIDPDHHPGRNARNIKSGTYSVLPWDWIFALIQTRLDLNVDLLNTLCVVGTSKEARTRGSWDVRYILAGAASLNPNTDPEHLVHMYLLEHPAVIDPD